MVYSCEIKQEIKTVKYVRYLLCWLLTEHNNAFVPKFLILVLLHVMAIYRKRNRSFQ